MDFIHVLSWGVVLVSSFFLGRQAISLFRYDKKAVKGFQIRNNKTGKQTTISATPNKADVKRFLDLVEH